MAKKTRTQGEVILQYLNEYPSWYPANSLARIIVKENSHTFDDPEAARALIRYYRGNMGNEARGKLSVKDFMESGKRASNKFAMPATLSVDRVVYKLPTIHKNIGFIADIQVPYHDPKAIDICFNHLTKKGIDCLFINGDLLDFYSISEYVRDPRERDFSGEYDASIEMLLYIKQSFPDIKIYYNLDANHEARWGKYMAGKAPELLGIKLFELVDLLKLSDIGIEPIENIHHVLIGKLPVIHGDTVFRRGSGVYPARQLYLKTKASCIASHVHRTSEYTGKNFQGEISTCYTTGMLMHPNIEYCKHVDEYNQGFAIIELDSNGDYIVNNKRIYKGKVF